AVPNLILTVEGTIPTLRVLVDGAGADTTLVVQGPDGAYTCDDDSDVRAPIVTLAGASGSYRVWVGAYAAGVQLPYTLALHEAPRATFRSRRAAAPAQAGGGAALQQGNAESNFGFIQLSPGLATDPYVTEGTSGAAEGSVIDAATLGAGCAGYITARPDHVFLAGADFEALSVVIRSEGDTTLVVRAPDGSFLCDDDGAGGRNPGLRGPLAAGSYAIWV